MLRAQIDTILSSCCQDELALRQSLDDLQKIFGDKVYSATIRALFSIDMEAETAKRYWQQALSTQTDAPILVSLRAILFDQIYRQAEQLNDPRIVDAQYLAKLQRTAVTDGLTRLYNQSHFKQQLEEMILQAAGKPSKTFSLLLFDLDHFKQFNDRCGHLRGDRVLSEVGQIIADQIPEDALAARYGGEEFAVILPNTRLAQAIILADKIRLHIEQTRFDGEDRLDKGNLTISGGVASYPASGSSLVALIAHADSKLYQAKITRNSISPSPSDSRSAIRHAFRSIVEVLDQQSGQYTNSLSADISYTGLLLKSQQSTEVGSTLELRFPFPFWPDNHHTAGQVRHVKNQDARGAYLIGVEFLQPQIDFIEKILPGEIYSSSNF